MSIALTDRPRASAWLPGSRQARARNPGVEAEAAPQRYLFLLSLWPARFLAAPVRLISPRESGCANHRLMHFAARQTGITVAELLDIFSITKQSLIRVLND
jgi:hypothetical protein